MYLLNDFARNRELMKPVLNTMMDLRIGVRDFRMETDQQENEFFGEEFDEDDGLIGIILTEELLLDSRFLYCLEMARTLYEQRKMEVVTALYGISVEQLPQRVQWLLTTYRVVMECENDQYMFGYYCAGRILRRFYLEENRCAYMCMLKGEPEPRVGMIE